MTDGSNIVMDELWTIASRDALDRLTHIARRTFGARNGFITASSSPDPTFQCRDDDPSAARAPPREDESIQTLCRQVIEGDRPIIIPIIEETSGPDDGGSIRSFLGVPIRCSDGTVAGTLSVCDSRPRDWSDEDVALLTQLGRSAIATIELNHETMARRKAEAALRTREARLEAVARYVPGLLFERRKVGPDTARYTYLGRWTDTLSDTVDLATPDERFDVVHPDDRTRVEAAIRHSIATETDLDLTFRVVSDAGPVRSMRSQSVVRHEADGTAVWDGLCFDISDLEAAREAAEAARVSRDTILVDVNHELRTPLQAIVGFTEFLQTETRLDVVRAHALMIQNASQSLLSIVNQLLDLASSEDGSTAPIDRQPTNVKMLTSLVHDMVAPLAGAKKIEMRLVVDPRIPPVVLADGPKLRQILINLLNNAIKFTEEGSVTLQVARQADRLRFSVSDTGIGIPDDKLEFLFQRFSRIEPERRATRGTGLGLAIVKQLVERMNGTIGVAGNLDRGTTFWFEMHAEPVETSLVEAVAPPIEHEPRSGGARILIADDLDLNRKLIADMLSLDGHEIDSVSDGVEAVRAAAERRYDLILMDMIMPVMDGIAATRAIRDLPAPFCEVPIIALTAHSFKEQLDSCLAAGMDATLTKPMSLDVLSKTVRSWTCRRSKAA